MPSVATDVGTEGFEPSTRAQVDAAEVPGFALMRPALYPDGVPDVGKFPVTDAVFVTGETAQTWKNDPERLRQPVSVRE